MRVLILLSLLIFAAVQPATAARRYAAPHAHRSAAASPSALKLPGLDGGSVGLSGDPALSGLNLTGAGLGSDGLGGGKNRKGADPNSLGGEAVSTSDLADASTTHHRHARGGGGGGGAKVSGAIGHAHASGGDSSSGSRPRKTPHIRH